MKFKLTKLAEETKQQKIDGTLEDSIFGSSDGFWYDLTQGGYFKLEEVLEDGEERERVQRAIGLLQELEEVYDQLVPEF